MPTVRRPSPQGPVFGRPFTAAKIKHLGPEVDLDPI